MSNRFVVNGRSLPYNPKLTDRAKEFRNNMTMAESKLWSEFLHKQKYRFRPQKQIDNYIADFYCAKLKLVIEVDGEIHNEVDQSLYDLERTKVFESYGLRVIRFKNDEIINQFDEVCKEIKKFIS